MRTLFAVVAALFVLGCSGGGGSSTPASNPPTVAWDKAIYSVSIPAGSTSEVSLDANVLVTQGSSPLPPTVGISCSPSGSLAGTGGALSCGNGPWQTSTISNGVATLPVRITVSPSAPKGGYVVTATLNIGSDAYKGTATVQVN
jgi:hypothetical protein